MVGRPRGGSRGLARDDGNRRDQGMHKSRLSGMIIDCQTQDLRAAADFWSQALGMEQIEKPTDEPAPSKYIHLKNKDSHMDIEVQKVPHPSRVHLDIETDN